MQKTEELLRKSSNNKLQIPCVIFAGGKSSRMGEDKALLPFGTFPTLTEYQLCKLQKIFSSVYISCKYHKKFDFDANFIEDNGANEIYAPTLGFLSVFQELKEEKFFVISVDTPFIKEATIRKILNTDTKHFDASIASCNSKLQPLCGIYHRSLESKFEEMLQNKDHKLAALLNTSKNQILNFKEEHEFLNLNKPDDYKQALSLLGK